MKQAYYDITNWLDSPIWEVLALWVRKDSRWVQQCPADTFRARNYRDRPSRDAIVAEAAHGVTENT